MANKKIAIEKKSVFDKEDNVTKSCPKYLNSRTIINVYVKNKAVIMALDK